MQAPGRQRPHGLAGLQGRVVLRPVEHRPPAHRVRVAEADELQAGGEQHRVQGVGEEAGHDQRGHRGDDLDHDDVDLPLAADPGRLQEVPAAQRERLRPKLAGGVGPAGGGDDDDQHQRAAAVRVARDDDQQREQRDDEQHVGDDAERAVPQAAEVGGGDADQHRDRGRGQPDDERDLEDVPGAPDQLGPHVLPVGGGAEQVGGRQAQVRLVGVQARAVVRDQAGEQRDQDEDAEQDGAGGRLAVRPHRAADPVQRLAARQPPGLYALPGGPCHLASLVRGSSSAVARSAIRIATSTATVMRRNSACISG